MRLIDLKLLNKDEAERRKLFVTQKWIKSSYNTRRFADLHCTSRTPNSNTCRCCS